MDHIRQVSVHKKHKWGNLSSIMGVRGPHYYKDYPYKHNNAPLVTIGVAANVPLCSGCGIDHLYKDCSMQRAPVDASNLKTTSLNLLGIERGCIA